MEGGGQDAGALEELCGDGAQTGKWEHKLELIMLTPHLSLCQPSCRRAQ